MKLITLLLPLLILLISCSVDPETPEASSNEYLMSSAISSKLMLQDDVTSDDLQSDHFAFKSTEMLSIEPLNDTQFTIKNFVPMDLKAVTITAQFEGITSVIKLLTLENVTAHSESIFNYPTVDGVDTYETMGGEVVVLDATKGFPITAVKLDFIPSTDKLQMLKDITVEWDCIFNDFFTGSDSSTQAATMWRPIRPAQARLYTLLVLNTSYLFSQQEYRDRFLNEPLYKYVDNETRIVEDDQWFTDAEKVALYNKIESKSFRLGITAGGGLGGGSALGISNSTLTKQFKYKWDDSLTTIDYLPSAYYTGPHPLYSHEMGHCFGYGHNSNMCSTGRRDISGTTGWEQMYGFPAVSVLLHSKYVHYGLLPCMQDEYYNQIDFEYEQPDRYAPY